MSAQEHTGPAAQKQDACHGWLARSDALKGDRSVSDDDLRRIPASARSVYRVLQFCTNADGVTCAKIKTIVARLNLRDSMSPLQAGHLPPSLTQKRMWRRPIQYRMVRRALKLLETIGLVVRLEEDARVRQGRWYRKSSREVRGLLWTDRVLRADWRIPMETLLGMQGLSMAGHGGLRPGAGRKPKSKQESSTSDHRSITAENVKVPESGTQAAPSASQKSSTSAETGDPGLGTSGEETRSGAGGANQVDPYEESSGPIVGKILGKRSPSGRIPSGSPPKEEGDTDMPKTARQKGPSFLSPEAEEESKPEPEVIIGAGWKRRKQERARQRGEARSKREAESRQLGGILVPDGSGGMKLGAQRRPVPTQAILACLSHLQDVKGMRFPCMTVLKSPARPRPPRIPLSMAGERSLVAFIAEAHRGAVKALFGKKAAESVFFKGIPRANHPQFKALAAAAALLRDEEISPIAWSYWNLEGFIAFRTAQTKKKPRTPPWPTAVFSVGVIMRKARWFNEDVADGLGGSRVLMPSGREALQRWHGMTLALAHRFRDRAPTPQDAELLAAEFFPANLWDQLIAKAEQEGKASRSEWLRRVELGDWVW